ncbi:YtxH domain-containing protein [Winogradskyella litorisediminis]|uniref:YtxH domain-containing protein n=1 Tax=Winogradskyella litorisediminis TaxID=1156618 RepID=A0ABW3N3R3_9FLAO
MSQNSNILGVLLGTAVGVGIGMLFAPDKGSETRKRIAENANAAKDTILTEADKLKSNVAVGAENLRNKVADTVATKKASLDSQLDTIVTDASYKADDIITSLERRLKILKAKNKNLQSK